MKISLNREQGLYVFTHFEYGKKSGVDCLGFDVAFNRAEAIAKELGRKDLIPRIEHKGTIAGYEEYAKATEAARLSGKRLECELVPELKGLEGKRVEVIDCYGEKRRFKVGKSTGFIPIHLELANSRSTGGAAVMGTPFKSIRVIK